MGRLSASAVKAAVRPGRVSDGDGLFLVVKEGGVKSWVCRVQRHGNRRDFGFRSAFRDWVSEETSHPGDVAEAALAHAIGNKTEAAYRRGNLLEKRRIMMADWAACVGVRVVACQHRAKLSE